MKLFFLALKLAAMAGIALLATIQTSACQCGASQYGKSRREAAKLETDWATVVFEGTPQRFEFQWEVLTASDGDSISADGPSTMPNWRPAMLLTFRVQRSYKGALGPEIQIRTGMGGGDCAAIYSPGLTYLIFAFKTTAGELVVTMCSPGGWIGDKAIAPELRYLRNERPIASDLAPVRRPTQEGEAAQAKQRLRDYDGFQTRYDAVTGKICGKIIQQTAANASQGLVAFLSADGYYPFGRPIAEVEPDGSFCSKRLGPGKYYLYFTRYSDAGLASAIYYPGASERTGAKTVEVSPGKTESNINFSIPAQKTYAVRGIISANEKSGLGAQSVEVALIRLDDGPLPAPYSRTIDFQSSYPLSKVKYFDFENVLAGRYIACVSVLFGQGWHTNKQVIDVTNHMKFITLHLQHPK
jgi:hypothetical protein